MRIKIPISNTPGLSHSTQSSQVLFYNSSITNIPLIFITAITWLLGRSVFKSSSQDIHSQSGTRRDSGSSALIKFHMDSEEMYDEHAALAEQSLDQNDQSISPAWGWFVAITPPSEFYIKQSPSVSRSSRDDHRQK